MHWYYVYYQILIISFISDVLCYTHLLPLSYLRLGLMEAEAEMHLVIVTDARSVISQQLPMGNTSFIPRSCETGVARS